MLSIGITGGVGCGKSRIMNYLKENYSCDVLLADEAAHLVRAKGSEAFPLLVEALGEDVLDADGEIDRGKMAAKIFADEELLGRINGIIHPAVRKYILNRMDMLEAEGSVDYFFLEAALLIEEKYDEILDEIWYIYADEDIRRERLRVSRHYTDEKIDAIMRNQLTDEEFREHCAFVIDNSGTLEDSFRQLDLRLERRGV